MRIILIEACEAKYSELSKRRKSFVEREFVDNEELNRIGNEIDFYLNLMNDSIRQCASISGCPNTKLPVGRYYHTNLDMG